MGFPETHEGNTPGPLTPDPHLPHRMLRPLCSCALTTQGSPTLPESFSCTVNSDKIQALLTKPFKLHPRIQGTGVQTPSPQNQPYFPYAPCTA